MLLATVIIKDSHSQWEAYFNVSSEKKAEAEIKLELKKYNDFALAKSYEQHNPRYLENGEIAKDDEGKDLLDCAIIGKEPTPEHVRELIEIISIL